MLFQSSFGQTFFDTLIQPCAITRSAKGHRLVDKPGLLQLVRVLPASELFRHGAYQAKPGAADLACSWAGGRQEIQLLPGSDSYSRQVPLPFCSA